MLTPGFGSDDRTNLLCQQTPNRILSTSGWAIWRRAREFTKQAAHRAAICHVLEEAQPADRNTGGGK